MNAPNCAATGPGAQEPRRRRAARTGHSDARGRGVVYGDHRDPRVLPGLHQPLEAAIRGRPARGAAGQVLRTAADRADPPPPPAMETRILAKTRQRPPDGSTHWSTRKLAKVFGISHVLVARVWRRAGLQPHRLERYMRSDDPHFEEKAADVLGLYLNPPQHAVVFAADESSTRSNCGLGRSNATSWLAVSSRRSPTSPARFGATSRATTRTRNRFAGPTALRRIE